MAFMCTPNWYKNSHATTVLTRRAPCAMVTRQVVFLWPSDTGIVAET